MTTMRDLVVKHKKLQHDYQHQFHATFGANLGSYIDMICGFDIVRFDDEVIKPPDGTSTRDAILAQYGEDAVKLVETLIA